MERKKTQRIIGIVVIIALVIIVIPLLFGKNDAPMQEAAVIKAPPFPDQPQRASLTTDATVTAANNTAPNPDLVTTSEVTNTIDQPAINTEKTAATDAAPAPVNQSVTTPAAAVQPATENTASGVNPDASQASTNESGIIYERPQTAEQAAKATEAVTVAPVPVASEPAPAAPAAAEVQKTDTQTISTLKYKPAVIKEKHKAKPVKSIFAKNKNTAEQLNKLKNAWAIQLGSFKVKQNAINLANKLRASGYKAFTREVKSSRGSVSTRVYIGPEFKQASAAKLSSDIQHNFSIQGFVIPYKPLEI